MTAHATTGGSARDGSWIYQVINPLLDVLPIEAGFLEGGNLTWRFFKREADSVRAIADNLSPAARHVLRDYRAANGEAAARFDRHDAALKAAVTAASKAFDSLQARAEFLTQVEKSLAQWQAEGGAYPGGAYANSEFSKLVAERVVNAIARIPDHYSDSLFWERYGEALSGYRTSEIQLQPELRLLPEFQRLSDCVQALLANVRELISWLEAESLRLCESYGLPAAPPVLPQIVNAW